MFSKIIVMVLLAGLAGARGAARFGGVIEIGHAAIFFREGHGWQDYISLLGGFGQENILHNQELQFRHFL